MRHAFLVGARHAVGDLGLTMMEERDLVAFLKTLTDGYGTAFPHDFPLPEVSENLRH